jgi:chromosomal replication initiation ATPase DnaA
MRQLAFDLPHREARGRDDFLVSDSNRQAVDMIDGWPGWPHPEMLLIGPEGSGKSHLSEVWRASSGAACVAARALVPEQVPDLVRAGALVVEDCGAGIDQRALFHLVNEMSRREGFLLLTARTPPVAWDLALDDLASRLGRMGVVVLELPDDRLMEAVLVKLFADRQLEVEPSVVRYLAFRLERSFAAMRDAVGWLDRMAIEEQRRVTRSLAARMLSQLQEPRD